VITREAGVRRESADATISAAALGVVGLTALVADRHPEGDRRVFSALNDHRDEPGILRGFQQLGTPWVLPGTAVIAAASGRRRLAAAAALALPLEKGLEVGLKKLRPTPRPLYVEPTVLRDDAPVEGESFPSGHAAIAWTAASLAAPYLPRYATAALVACAAVSSAVRVSQGAHHPIDSVGGAALGIGIGAGLTWAIGRDA
jgi:membrane-associated phospholipid phosphatase